MVPSTNGGHLQRRSGAVLSIYWELAIGYPYRGDGNRIEPYRNHMAGALHNRTANIIDDPKPSQLSTDRVLRRIDKGVGGKGGQLLPGQMQV